MICELAVPRICINGSTFTGVFSAALDLAIQNFRVTNLQLP
jgi:hypothetical protein